MTIKAPAVRVMAHPASFSTAEVVGSIVALTTVIAPFNALVTVGFAGELSGELYFIVQLALLPIVVLMIASSFRDSVSSHLPAIFFLISISIAFSYLANYSSI